jgi:hypothetical protein
LVIPLAFVGIAVLAGLITTIAVIVPKMQDSQRRLACMNQLSTVAQAFVTDRLQHPGAAPSVPPPAPFADGSGDPGCLYDVRDFAKFPLDPNATEPQVIAACIHHRRGVVVAYDDGSCQFLTLEDLGLYDDDEKSVGPDSISPALRVLK